MPHVPVLLNEVLAALDPRPGDFMIDGTSGSGGHTRAIQEKIGPTGTMLAIDWEKTGENYADLPEILETRKLGKANGLLLDLGMSSEQIESSGRGFSFLKDEPLLMTYNPAAKPARDALRELNEEELVKIFRELGEERFSGRIARVIKEHERRKPIETTGELVAAILEAVPRRYERGRIHPATRVFMALRIYVNRELENLERILKNLNRVVASGGRVAIITFHSLEDRLIKNYFRELAKVGNANLITKKPIRASRDEVVLNPRSRSAKLRVLQIL